MFCKIFSNYFIVRYLPLNSGNWFGGDQCTQKLGKVTVFSHWRTGQLLEQESRVGDIFSDDCDGAAPSRQPCHSIRLRSRRQEQENVKVGQAAWHILLIFYCAAWVHCRTCNVANMEFRTLGLLLRRFIKILFIVLLSFSYGRLSGINFIDWLITFTIVVVMMTGWWRCGRMNGRLLMIVTDWLLVE